MGKTWNVPLTDEQCADLMRLAKLGASSAADDELIEQVEYLISHSTPAR